MSTPPISYRKGAAWMAIVAIGVLSLLPKEHIVRTGLGGHIEHVVAYTLTAFIVTSAYGIANRLTIAVGLIAYAGVLELLQNFSPGRTPAVEDFLCSATGVVLGIALYAFADRFVPLVRRT